MPNHYPNNYAKIITHSVIKSLLGMVPASLTIPYLSSNSDKLNHGVLASLTVFFSRVGETLVKYAYSQQDLNKYHLMNEAKCSIAGAENYLNNNLAQLSEADTENIKQFLLEQGISENEIKLQLDSSEPSMLKKIITLMTEYDLFSMVIAGAFCYYMPIPPMSTYSAKVFNSSVASVVSSATNLAINFFSAPNKGCYFFKNHCNCDKNANSANTIIYEEGNMMTSLKPTFY